MLEVYNTWIVLDCQCKTSLENFEKFSWENWCDMISIPNFFLPHIYSKESGEMGSSLSLWNSKHFSLDEFRLRNKLFREVVFCKQIFPHSPVKFEILQLCFANEKECLKNVHFFSKTMFFFVVLWCFDSYFLWNETLNGLVIFMPSLST